MEKKNYFITGGTGSLAKKLVEQLIKKKLARKITIFSRDEYKQSNMLNLPFIKKNLSIFRFFIGDIRDISRLDWALSRYDDVVIHAAALKQVPVTEYNPFETVKTNIMGTQNLIEVCIKKNINKIILASTDKAVSPINLYGSTKLTAEKLFISANLFKGKNKCKFSVARYGNVMGSRGSIIPILIKQNNFGKYFTITNKNMTRFSLTLNDATNFILNAIHKMKGKEIFVPKIPSYRILDIAKAINPKKKIKYIGIRSGEKLHEELINSSEFLKSKENYKEFILYPLNKNIKNDTIYNSSYNSYDNKKYLDVNKIKELIKNNISDFDL
jgi:UDP-N-acetylglucosamine 4,6-dehydratase